MDTLIQERVLEVVEAARQLADHPEAIVLHPWNEVGIYHRHNALTETLRVDGDSFVGRYVVDRGLEQRWCGLWDRRAPVLLAALCNRFTREVDAAIEVGVLDDLEGGDSAASGAGWGGIPAD